MFPWVATQAIRKGRNRAVLDRIDQTGSIFEAWQDEPWINDGAAVRVSLVCFGPRVHGQPVRINAQLVDGINPDLTPVNQKARLSDAKPLMANIDIAFQGPVKVGPFDIPGSTARAWIGEPNPHGKPNHDVMRPWANGQDLTRRPTDTWIIDFGPEMSEKDASLYELPFAHVATNVRPLREAGRREGQEALLVASWRNGTRIAP